MEDSSISILRLALDERLGPLLRTFAQTTQQPLGRFLCAALAFEDELVKEAREINFKYFDPRNEELPEALRALLGTSRSFSPPSPPLSPTPVPERAPSGKTSEERNLNFSQQ